MGAQSSADEHQQHEHVRYTRAGNPLEQRDTAIYANVNMDTATHALGREARVVSPMLLLGVCEFAPTGRCTPGSGQPRLRIGKRRRPHKEAGSNLVVDAPAHGRRVTRPRCNFSDQGSGRRTQQATSGPHPTTRPTNRSLTPTHDVVPQNSGPLARGEGVA